MIGPKWTPFKVNASETSAYISMDRWGKDHWTTLAYFETLIVDHGGMVSNARMRCNPRLHRNFAWMTPFSPHTAKGEYPTRLKDDVKQPGHDDWSCLEDMIAAGVINGYFRQMSEATFGNSQAYVELTESGRVLAAELRAHKASGGTYANFAPVDVLIAALKAAAIVGIQEIEDGDVFRPELKDVVFTQIVGDNRILEDKVIDVMQKSGEWIRLYDGWSLKSQTEAIR